MTRRRGLTPFMVLLAGFETLLHRLSGQEEFAVGVAAIGRGRVEIERLIGLFLNMLVLRADLSGEPTFAQVLDRVRDASLEAFAHQDIPLEKLVEAVAPDRGRNAAPLFQVAFGFDRPPPAELRAGDVEMKLLDAEITTARYDLTLWVREQSDGLDATWTYSTDLFEAETIERMHRQFETLLAAAVSAPETCIADLELRSATELQRDTVEQRNREDSKHQRLLRATPRVVSAASPSAE
nr:condensation domain-containing protein [Mesorhizobium mediterraneum]